MNRLAVVVTASVLVLLGANGLVAAVAPVDQSLAMSKRLGCALEGEHPLPMDLAAGPVFGFSNCPRYHRCICHCQQEEVCCNNGGGQNCFE